MATTKKHVSPLEAAREGRRLDDVAYEVRQLLPHLRCSRELLRKYEKGMQPEETWNPQILAALSVIYNKPISKLSRRALQANEAFRTLLTEHAVTSSYPDMHPDQGRLFRPRAA